MQGFLSGVLCPGVFCQEALFGVVFVRPPSVRIHPLQQKAITFNFRFHMYEKNWKSVTSHALGPLPLSQTVTPARTPLERDVLYGGPLSHQTENDDFM